MHERISIDPKVCHGQACIKGTRLPVHQIVRMLANGDTILELTIANIRDPKRQQEVSFLVDTGATRAWIPQGIAEAIGIQPAGTVSLEMAEGSMKEFPYGFCVFDFGGETVAGNVVIGPPEREPIVGTHVLQDFRLVIDMERGTISRSRAMRAKRVFQRIGG